MIYTLFIWTAIACSQSHCQYDWRPIGEFQTSSQENGQKLCEEAIRKMGMKAENARCIRSK